MKSLLALALAAVVLTGCASSPSISQLNEGVTKVVLVRNGTAPLRYSTGVIDTSSFWAAYGGGVSNQLGGGTLWTDLEKSGQREVDSKAAQNAAMMKKLFNEHDMAVRVSSALLPQLAATWSVPYDEKGVITLTDKPAYVDPNTGLLQGLETDADLVLMTEVANVTLTERFSMGGALKAGLTMGAGKKSLTTAASVLLRAFKRNEAGTGYEVVWFRMCGPDYTTMKTSYYLEELMESEAKMKEILEEATVQAIDSCGQTLDLVRKQNLAAHAN